MQISEQILNMKDDCVKIRRDLHRIPEIGFELHKTHEYIKPIIEACRPDELKVLAEVGLKAVFYAKGADRTIAFRADMDGMKNTEENKFRFRSRNTIGQQRPTEEKHSLLRILFDLIHFRTSLSSSAL